MSQESARDPYVGINQHISQRANKEQHQTYTIGRILSLDPIKIRADGIDLEKEDLRVAESMYPNFLENIEDREENGVETLLPEKLVEVTQSAIGPFVFLRPEEHVFGWVVLNVDDEVLLMRSDDGQTYYLIERMVTLE